MLIPCTGKCTVCGTHDDGRWGRAGRRRGGAVIALEGEQRERLHVKLRRELGREVLQALEAPGTEDILLNPDASLWVKSTGRPPCRIGELGASQAASAIGTLAALSGEVVNARQPVLETELPIAEARFEGLLPPLVARPAFAIRCLPRSERTLEDYAREGIVTDGQRTLDAVLGADAAHGGGPIERFLRALPPAATQLQVLREAIRARLNILVVGATGAGKTSLVNVLLATVAAETPEDRVVIVEDTAELRCGAPNVVKLHLCETVSIRRALRVCLRLKPQRLVVGELRGPEALTLVKAWGTGHCGGLSTVHAGSAPGGLLRLEALALEAGGMRLPLVRPWIASAVQLVVAIAEDRSVLAGRRVQEIVLVRGLASGGRGYDLETLATPRRPERPHEPARAPAPPVHC